MALTRDHEAEWIDAIHADFGGRSAQETRLAEIFVLTASIRHALRHLRHWMRPRRMPTPWHFLPAGNQLLAQPLGTVGIVSPWNYPLQLALAPAVGALAAGNRVMIKPSELSPALAQALACNAARHFAPDELLVVPGDATVAQEFCALPFDHLVFTGSGRIGRDVARSASRHLTTLTLELGGKSPAVVDASANVHQAAASIAAAKLFNAGQTCVAPDYVIVPAGQSSSFARLLHDAMTRCYARFIDNPDYTAILGDHHRNRLLDLIADSARAGARIIEVNPAGESEAASRKILPRIILGATPSLRVMQEEIFGPVLPVIEVQDAQGAIDLIRQGERPLALYWFGRDARARDRVLQDTHSGGVTVNDTLWHAVQDYQPFGGVGASGYGAYHGEWGFHASSKLKPVFRQSRLNAAFLLRPPYGRTFDRVLRYLDRIT